MNLEKTPSLFVSKPTIKDPKYEEIDKKNIKEEFAPKRNSVDHDKFGSAIFFLTPQWIVGLNQQIILSKWIYIFLERCGFIRIG